MIINGALVTLIDSASQQVGALDAELARLSQRRQDLQAAIEQGIRGAVADRGHELPERWEARPSDDGLGLIVSWEEE